LKNHKKNPKKKICHIFLNEKNEKPNLKKLQVVSAKKKRFSQMQMRKKKEKCKGAHLHNYM
jgi:hypothetical protein